MTYEIYHRYIFCGGAILAGVMFITSVLLFIFLKIPTVLGDLTGRTARKAIEEIRSQNEKSGDKVHKTSVVNRERGKITDKISPSGNLIRNPSDVLGGAMATEKIGTQNLAPEVADETTILDTAADETTVLTTEGGETTLLDVQSETTPVFQIEYEITYIHTDEVIA